MVGTGGQGLRPGAGAPHAAQRAFIKVNARPRPALEGSCWRRTARIILIDLLA